MKITDATLTTDGHFSGTILCDRDEQARWLALAKERMPENVQLQRLRRIALHDSEIEVDVEGIPVLGSVTADIVLKTEGG
jgi:hypothetical protein